MPRAGASRGVIAQIDQELERIEARLSGYEQLVSERKRLLAARAALTGTARSARRVSREQVATYLREHPGSLPAQIARDLEVPVTNISQHLYRGKGTCFLRRSDGWHLSE
ncbi:MAG TPA: hypothetical protein VKU89_11145 [Solirubrobacteraceae bacterium]|nr:hypothetical protein [Solirubrobacteraceae bacterium]